MRIGAAIAVTVVASAGTLIALLVPPALRNRAAAAAASYVTVDSPNAPAYAAWADSALAPLQSRLQVWIFNLTNPDAVLRGARPAMVPVGPLPLLRRTQRHDATWQDSGDVVAFRETVTHSFDTTEAVVLQERQQYLAQICGAGPMAAASPSPGVVLPSADDDSTDDDYVSGGSSDAGGGGTRGGGGSPSGSGGGGGGSANPCNSTYGPSPAVALPSLDSLVTTVNMPFVIAAVNGYAWLAVQAGDDQLFVTRSIRQVLFGYESPLLTALAAYFPAGAVPTTYSGLLGNTTAPAQDNAGASGITTPSYNRMYTGAATTYRARELLTWDGMDELYCCLTGPCGAAGPAGIAARPAWGSSLANDVRGSEGTQFRAGIAPGDSLRTFTPSLARSVQLDNVDGATASHHGITALRFTLSNATLAPATEEAANADYYAFGYAAMLNVTNCAGNAPVFASKPFFLGSNASIAAAAGLPMADPASHDTFVDIEPTTGMVLGMHHRWQWNLYLDPYLRPTGALQQVQHAPPQRQLQAALPNSQPVTQPLFPQLRSLYLPLIWFDRHGQITADAAAALDTAVLLPDRIAKGVFITGIVVAVAAVAAGLALAFKSRNAKASHRAEAWERGMVALMGDNLVTLQSRRALLSEGGSGGAAGGAAVGATTGAAAPPPSGGGGDAAIAMQLTPPASGAGGSRLPARIAAQHGGRRAGPATHARLSPRPSPRSSDGEPEDVGGMGQPRGAAGHARTSRWHAAPPPHHRHAPAAAAHAPASYGDGGVELAAATTWAAPAVADGAYANLHSGPGSIRSDDSAPSATSPSVAEPGGSPASRIRSRAGSFVSRGDSIASGASGDSGGSGSASGGWAAPLARFFAPLFGPTTASARGSSDGGSASDGNDSERMSILSGGSGGSSDSRLRGYATMAASGGDAVAAHR